MQIKLVSLSAFASVCVYVCTVLPVERVHCFFRRASERVSFGAGIRHTLSPRLQTCPQTCFRRTDAFGSGVKYEIFMQFTLGIDYLLQQNHCTITPVCMIFSPQVQACGLATLLGPCGPHECDASGRAHWLTGPSRNDLTS